jgi:hypothetical protein
MEEKEKPMEEQQVRKAIQSLIKRKELYINQVVFENRHEIQATKRMTNEMRIVELEYSVSTLIELEHDLRLCDCPDEAYVKGSGK